MPQVSFARDIGPLFRDVDISHMEPHGIKLDDYTFMSDPDNANKVPRSRAAEGLRKRQSGRCRNFACLISAACAACAKIVMRS